VQQGTRHLDTASIAPTQLPNFLVPKFFEGEPFELKLDPRVRSPSRFTLQRRKVP
jgi:hypothetical protein